MKTVQTIILVTFIYHHWFGIVYSGIECIEWFLLLIWCFNLVQYTLGTSICLSRGDIQAYVSSRQKQSYYLT